MKAACVMRLPFFPLIALPSYSVDFSFVWWCELFGHYDFCCVALFFWTLSRAPPLTAAGKHLATSPLRLPCLTSLYHLGKAVLFAGVGNAGLDEGFVLFCCHGREGFDGLGKGNAVAGAIRRRSREFVALSFLSLIEARLLRHTLAHLSSVQMVHSGLIETTEVLCMHSLAGLSGACA